ncbi:hypothetical protein WUBG_17653, partial [Wuchereria bancrofti]
MISQMLEFNEEEQFEFRFMPRRNRWLRKHRKNFILLIQISRNSFEGWFKKTELMIS